MDIPTSKDESCSKPPPPTYDELEEIPLYEDILPSPPPAYITKKAPPPYMVSEHPLTPAVNAHPSMSQPPPTVGQQEQSHFQEIHPQPSTVNMQPVMNQPTQFIQAQSNFQHIQQNPVTVAPYVINEQPQIAMRQEHVIVQQAAPQMNPHVVVVQPQYGMSLSDSPTNVVCKFCQRSITTNVHYRPGVVAWSMCFCIAIIGGFCGFCLIPLFVQGFLDAHHSCPSCQRPLGVYARKL